MSYSAATARVATGRQSLPASSACRRDTDLRLAVMREAVVRTSGTEHRAIDANLLAPSGVENRCRN